MLREELSLHSKNSYFLVKEAVTHSFLDIKKLIYNVSTKYLNSSTDSEDIVQEVLLTIYLKNYSFRGQADIKTWIYRITINNCLNFFKKNRRLPPYQLNFWETPSYSENPENKLIQSENSQDLIQSLSLLSPKQKKALILNSLMGYSQKETAKIMNLSIKALESNLYRGKKKLKKYLIKNFSSEGNY